MNMTPESAVPAPDDTRSEYAVQIATRFVALLRTARSYQIGNQAFTQQVDNFLAVVQTAFATHGEIQLLDFEGDLHMNGVRLPLRGANMRFIEQLQQEFHAREISGLVLVPGLQRAEFESFLRYFLATDVYKGMDLFRGCENEGIQHVFPAFIVNEAEAGGAEPAAATAATQAFPDAQATYHRALQLVEALTESGRGHGGVELRHLKRVVQPLVDAALTEGPLLDLTPRSEGRLPAGTHALHVSLVAISVGAQLGLDRHTLADLGAGALLHDSGKAAVADGITGPPSQWCAAQREHAQSHTIAGLRQIARTSSFNESSLSAMRIALEHHAWGPNGWPALPSSYRRSPLSGIVAIADAYVCLLGARHADGTAYSPGEALGAVLGPLAPCFDAALRIALVRATGLYPSGQLVRLDDGSLAISHGCESAEPERPLVEMLSGPNGEPLEAGELRFAQALAPERRVARSLPRREWPAQDGQAA